jgi:hypothetical protein
MTKHAADLPNAAQPTQRRLPRRAVVIQQFGVKFFKQLFTSYKIGVLEERDENLDNLWS